LWKTKKAPAAISAKPKPWLSVTGSRRERVEIGGYIGGGDGQ
jgi:hypothetical protein